MPDQLSSQIDTATQSGHSPDDIIGHLASSRADLAPKIQEAKSHGYSSDDILGYLKKAPAPATVPGMEKLGGTPPPAGMPPIYKGHFAPGAQRWDAAGDLSPLAPPNEVQRNPIVNAITNVTDYPGSGVRQMLGGVAGMANEGIPAKARAASDILRGAGKVGTLLLPGAAAAAPLATAASLVGGTVAAKGTGAALDAAGVNPAYSDLASDVAGIAGGGAAARLGSYSAISTVKNAVRNLPKNVNNPVQEAALQYAESKDVPISVGQRTGQPGLQHVEQSLENVPGSSTKAHEFYNNQQDALARVGQDEASKVSPTSTNAYGAGQGVQQALQSKITASKGVASKFYDEVRADAAKNQQVKQVGTKASTVLDQNGKPIQTPVSQTFETPVDLAPFQQSLQPIYDDISSAMPVAQQQASPAFAVLKSIMSRDMSGPQRYMNAVDFDQSLGAIKAIAREGQNPYLTSRSQGVAKELVKNGEQQLQQALSGAGPQVQAKLQAARSAVKDYHETADLLNSLNDEPAAMYSNLVTGGDRSYSTLSKLAQIAPDEVKTMGRTFLQGMMDTATREGGFTRAPGIMQQWDRLGPQTKKLLFGAQAPDVDNFVMAARTLTKNSNPSGTAKMTTALGSYGAAGSALAAILTGHPAVAGAVGAGMVGSRLAAELLLTPGVSRTIAQAIPKFSGPGAAAGAAASSAVGPERIFPREHLPEFAKEHNMTIDEAKRELDMQGYRVQ